MGRPKLRASSSEPRVAARPAARSKVRGLLELDRIIHERMRLGIVSALAAQETLTFNELKALLRATDGNLSVHARKLEDAGYIVCTKTFEDRMPRSAFRLTAAGRKAFERYLSHLEAVIKHARGR
ncbi:MAG: transcriptional regulator [Acidobacteriota bacterium]|nr:transcriptional regulator [Acidobacteriota bacterium]